MIMAMVPMLQESLHLTIMLRPASTIGVRHKSSFFARLYATHTSGQYPNGTVKVSLVDTRDIGRAMAWLGTYQNLKMIIASYC